VLSEWTLLVADICKVINAYQACFGPLGSMTADGDE